MNKKKLLWQLPFLLVLVLGTIYIIRQQHVTPYQHDEGFVFGTIYHITYQSDENYQKEIEAELQKVDNSLSPFNKTSIISRINRNEEVKVNDMFQEVFDLAEDISQETDGAFDITVAPMVNAWGFGFKQGKMPSKEAVDSLKAIVGFHKVKLVDGHVKKENPNTMLDCSATAPNYRPCSTSPTRRWRRAATIATSIIRTARSMPIPSTQRPVILCSTTSCQPR